MQEINIHIALYHFAYIGHIHRLVKCHPPLHNLHDVRGEWGGEGGVGRRGRGGEVVLQGYGILMPLIPPSPSQKKKDFLLNTFKRHSLN